MARCASLVSRSGAPLAIEMVELEQDQEMEDMLLGSPADSLDFFGAIRDLVETKITPEDLRKHAPRREYGDAFGAAEFPPPAANGGGGSSVGSGKDDAAAEKIVQDCQLRAENLFLRGRVSELELALQDSQETSHRLVSRWRVESRGRGVVAQELVSTKMICPFATFIQYVHAEVLLLPRRERQHRQPAPRSVQIDFHSTVKWRHPFVQLRPSSSDHEDMILWPPPFPRHERKLGNACVHPVANRGNRNR